MKGMWGLNCKNLQIPTSYTNNIHSQVPEGRYMGGAASLWLELESTLRLDKYIALLI